MRIYPTNPHYPLKGEMQYIADFSGKHIEVSPTPFAIVWSIEEHPMLLFRFYEFNLCYNIAHSQMQYFGPEDLAKCCYKTGLEDMTQHYSDKYLDFDVNINHFSLQHIVNKGVVSQLLTFGFKIPDYENLNCFAHGLFEKPRTLIEDGLFEYKGLRYYPLIIPYNNT